MSILAIWLFGLVGFCIVTAGYFIKHMVDQINHRVSDLFMTIMLDIFLAWIFIGLACLIGWFALNI